MSGISVREGCNDAQKEVKNASNQTIGLYYFDGDGRRVKKVTNTETVIFIFDAAGKLVAEYSTSPSETPQVQYLTNDHLGTPRINTNENGAVVSRTDYMPYGEEIIGLGGRSTTDKYVTDDVRQGFTGYINDEETNLDYAQARMYRKELGRFTSADQIFLEMGRRSFPQSFNLFSYVRNNPLSFSDSTGLDVLVSCKTNGKTKAEVSSQQAACESGTSTNLNNRKSAQFKVVVKDGRLAIVGSVDRATLSDREKKLYDTITDSGPGSVRSTLNVFATSDSITFGRYDGPGANSVDLSDLEVFNKTGDKSISGEVIAHEIIEGTISASTLVDEGELNGKSMSDAVYERAHKQADKFFGGATIRADPVPDGASVQSREVTYNFSILNVDVRVNKTFDVKQPAASVNRPFEKLPGKIDRATIVPKSN